MMPLSMTRRRSAYRIATLELLIACLVLTVGCVASRAMDTAAAATGAAGVAVETTDAVALDFTSNGDFEQDISGWRSYQPDDGTVLSQSADQAYSGKHSLKVETPAEAPTHVQGTNATYRVTPGEGYVISVRVKGEGMAALWCTGANGWTRGNKIALTPEWQELKVRRFEAGNSIELHVLGTTPEKRTFYVDDVKVVMDAKNLPDAEVAPVWFEAEGYKWSMPIADVSASGGAYTEGTRPEYPLAHQLPFPQTAKPVYVYLKSWVDAHAGTNAVHVWDANNLGVLFQQSFPAAAKWTWIKMGPLTAKQVDMGFTVAYVWNPPDASVKARLDAVVMTTRNDLTDEELKNIEIAESGYDSKKR